MEKELFSVIVLCYRKFEFVYEAIDSVLKQKYSNIELIVSDDGSDEFPEEKILNFIKANKKENISRVIINHEKKNLGTVRHLNHAQTLANGKYVVFLAADDRFYDENVLEKYCDNFAGEEPECVIEMAHTAMCDYTLKEIQGYYLQPEIEKLLKTGGKQLYEALAYKPYLPSTSTCFKKEFFKKYGAFDERYYLVEDVPMHLRLAREGWKIHYANFVAIKHRTGGISHGNIGGLSRTGYLYLCDLYNIKKYEVEPYYSFMSKDTRREIRQVRRHEMRNWGYDKYVYEHNTKEILKLTLRYPGFMFGKVIGQKFNKLENVWRKWIRVGVFLGIFSTLLKIAMEIMMQEGLLAWKVSEGMLVLISSGLIYTGGIVAVFAGISRMLLKIEWFPEECLTLGEEGE